MFEKIGSWIKGALNKLINKTDIKTQLGIETSSSAEMENAILLWDQMYRNTPPWLDGERVRHSLNMPAIIAGKISKMVTVESGFSCTGSPRADYLSLQLKRVYHDIRRITEYAAARGGLVFKPRVVGQNIVTEYIQANSFYPISFDSDGTMTGAIFVSQKTIGDVYYTRLESHELKNGIYTIRNKAFRSYIENTLGMPCGLDVVDDWAQLQPETFLSGIKRPLFSYFRMPTANNIDQSSPLGISIYARAVDTICDLDEQYSELVWEFRGGELGVFASVEMFKQDKNGNAILPKGSKRLYRTLDDTKSENFYEVFSPAFRDQSLLNGFNAILRQIETQCGLAFGTLSDVSSVEKTATETIHSKQESYTTVNDIQKALQDALENLLYAMDVWATIYKIAPQGSYETAFDWDDSIITDKEATRTRYWGYVVSGKFPFKRFLMEFEGYSEDEAQEIVTEASSAVGDPYADTTVS